MDQPRGSSTLDWTAEDEHWYTNYKTRPYAGTQDLRILATCVSLTGTPPPSGIQTKHGTP